ncbi:MAG TPA: amidohydrolase [Phycisphaerae bacterium]|nr:amidohydrolase [Phycisphaerae bacterium]
MNAQAKKRLVRGLVAAEARRIERVADAIADLAEPGFGEVESSRLLAGYLQERGFAVEWPWRHMPTAFKAARGRGRPVVGLLAEYDALPNCGPREGTWGHGCGHNLLGAGSAAGAVAAAEALAQRKLPGKVVLWGCPAEEILAGKVYMARDGAFRRHDAILSWHPGSSTRVCPKGGSSMDSVLFEFFGKTAHGAYAAAGRSALDGVMLLDVAANYLREHVPENVRIHMCILDGGEAPNVVPAYAKAWYYVRGKDREQVDDVRKRLLACARGAATATETKLKVTRLAGCYSRLENAALAGLLDRNLRLFGPPRVTGRDRELVKALGKEPEFAAKVEAPSDSPGRGSSDEDNVSWLAPFGQFTVACVSKKDVTGHHRDYAAQMKLPHAHRGMLRAAETLAAAVVDLCTTPRLLAKARAEFRKATKSFRYDPLVPQHQKPPTHQP